MELPAPVKEFLTACITQGGRATALKKIPGGCINECYAFESADRSFFLKVNSSRAFPGMFEAEYKGLQLLAGTNTFTVPEPLFTAAESGTQYLLMSFLQRAAPGADYFFSAGQLLAKLHLHTAEYFGLEHDNYIGSLKQENKQTQSFSEFFICSRIEPLLRRALDEGSAEKSITRNFEQLFRRLDEIIPHEKPGLLHGDLWSGNIMPSGQGPAVYDPAVYYGHREADLAMTRLFGGFDEDFYRGYESINAPEKNWKERSDIFNLYPLLVHLLLFGSGYYSDIKSIVRRF